MLLRFCKKAFKALIGLLCSRALSASLENSNPQHLRLSFSGNHPDILISQHIRGYTVKPVLSGHRIKRTPSIKRTVAKVPKFISII